MKMNMRLFQGTGWAVLISAIWFASAVAAIGQSQQTDEKRSTAMTTVDLEITEIESNKNVSIITVRDGDAVRLKLRMFETPIVNINNTSDLDGYIDVIAFDSDDAILEKAVIEVAAFSQRNIDVVAVLDTKKASEFVTIVVSFELYARESFSQEAYSVNAAFFSQTNSLWKNDVMKPSTLKVGDYGCAMTSACMLLAGRFTNLTPKTLNAYLSRSDVKGYTSGGLLNWDKIPGFQPSAGVVWIGRSVNINGTSVNTLKSASTMKWLLDNGYYIIAGSTRYGGSASSPGHWVAIWRYVGSGSSVSDFEYLDPMDSQYKLRKVGDSYVKTDRVIRLFK